MLVSNKPPRRTRLTRRQRVRIKARLRTEIRALLNHTRHRPPAIAEPEIPPDLPVEMEGLDETALIASITRTSFYEFVKEFINEVFPDKPKWNWHVKYLCDQMQRIAHNVAEGKPKEYDLVVNISPGTTKSTIISVMFPAWVWTFFPQARFICCCHGERLGLSLSRRCRQVLRSEKYARCFPHVQMRKDQDTKLLFANTSGGERYTVGTGSGAVMGNHAHFILIDDPIDPESVLSEVELERVNNWIDEQLSGRKVDKMVTVTVLVMQRLHQSDPTAMMLKMPKVKHVKLPATDEFPIVPASLRRYYKDGLMDPQRLGREVLEEVKKRPRGDYIFAGQNGQDPVPPGGGMFKVGRIRFGKPPRHFKSLIRFWDKAGSYGKGAYTVGLLMGYGRDGRIWILDVKRFQVDSFEREKVIRQTAKRDGYHITVGLEQEGGSGGKESVENTVRRLVGYRVVIVVPKGKKEDRADLFSVQVNSGNVWMPRYLREGERWTGWAEEYVEELKYFPFSTYKDQVDASSGALTAVTRQRRQVGGMKRSSRFDLG
jgi:predicted phage terminase large subunit-like protein